MALIYEPASLAPVPGDVELARRIDALVAQADRDAASIADLGFVTALDRAFDLPAPTDAERIVVLGIGGSALGTRVVHEACRASAARPITVVDNIDPDAIEAAWAGGDPARTAWVPVSKSGGTTETLAQVALVRARCAERGVRPRWFAVTGPRGALRDLAEAEGWPTAPVPEDVGGRFSVFTPAATVPLAMAGHDVAALLDGARDAARQAARPGSIAARLAALLVAALEQGRNVVALWSYAERLEVAGEWFRQLWAESLGKRRADGRAVGQTPLHCVGSTDQHSIQQLMVEGPPDKVVLVLCGPTPAEPAAPGDAPGAGAGHAFGDVLTAMRRATTAAMVRAGCPAATLRLDAWDERSVGNLLMQFLCATVLAGRLLDVDPFGQPGVEAAKTATRDLLAQPGGEADGEIARLLGEGHGVRCP